MAIKQSYLRELALRNADGMDGIRKKMNKKSHKGRHYGTDGYRHGGHDAPSTSGDGATLGEHEEQGLSEMHDGVVPGAFTANVMLRMPNERTDGKQDMKKQNRRKAPRKRSFAEFLKYRHRAEEEETWDDQEPENPFDRWEHNQERDPEFDRWLDDLESQEDYDEIVGDETDPEIDIELSALRKAVGQPENEEEWDDEDYDSECGDDEFDDEFDQEIDDQIDDEDIEDLAHATGTFADFYRMDDEEPREEEAEEIGPGGFEPGRGVGPDNTTPTTPGNAGGGTKKHQARIMYKQLANDPDMSRRDIIDAFIQQLGVTESTAVSYYEQIAKEFGDTHSDGEDMMGDGVGTGEDDMMGEPGLEEPEMEMSQEEVDAQDPDRKGIIRQVDNAHLVYKRQMEDGGFEELWVFNVADQLDDALNIRRAILAGTDIPRGHTRSEDGSQSYTLSTMGNAQMLHITGLAN